jgi:hypothetical protein
MIFKSRLDRIAVYERAEDQAIGVLSKNNGLLGERPSMRLKDCAHELYKMRDYANKKRNLICKNDL